MDEYPSDDMLFGAAALPLDSSQESLTDAALTYWKLTDGSVETMETSPSTEHFPQTNNNTETCGQVVTPDHGVVKSTHLGAPCTMNESCSSSHEERLPTPEPAAWCRHDVIARIEKVFESQIDGLMSANGHLAVTLKTRVSNGDTNNYQVHDGAITAKFRTQIFRFPGKSTPESWKYSESTSKSPSRWRLS